jgi:hypothetical protein
MGTFLKYKLCLCILAACCLIACEKTEKVEDFPVHQSKLVTNCFFSPDSSFVFHLSKSLSPLDNAPFAVMKNPSAFIRVYEDNVLFDSIRVSDGVFQGSPDKKARAGHDYRFECLYPGFGLVKGSDHLFDSLAIASLKGTNHIEVASHVNDTITYFKFNSQLDIALDRPVPAGAYLIIDVVMVYTVKDPATGLLYEYTYPVYDFMAEDLAFNNELINNSLFIPDNGKTVEKLTLHWGLTSNSTTGSPSNLYRITVKSCTRNTYDYIKRSRLQYQNQNDPFSQPAPIPNQIENGFGIFGGISEQRINIRF